MDEFIIKYRIVSIDEQNHSFIVRYFTDDITEILLANYFDENNNIICTNEGYPVRCRTDVNLTLWNLNTTNDEIEELIKKSAPTEWFKMQYDLNNNPTNTSPMQFLKNQLGVEKEFLHKPITNIELSEEEINQLIENLNK